jgi:hypothetical protein
VQVRDGPVRGEVRLQQRVRRERREAREQHGRRRGRDGVRVVLCVPRD